jgi:hypothetical protein
MAWTKPTRRALSWLAVAGAVLALPVAVFTTCQVRGPYVQPPEEKWPIGPRLAHEGTSLLIGLVVGAVLVVVLALVAVRLRRSKPDDGSGAGPAGPGGLR